jgi:hypothetical protein
MFIRIARLFRAKENPGGSGFALESAPDYQIDAFPYANHIPLRLKTR